MTRTHTKSEYVTMGCPIQKVTKNKTLLEGLYCIREKRHCMFDLIDPTTKRLQNMLYVPNGDKFLEKNILHKSSDKLLQMDTNIPITCDEKKLKVEALF